MEENKKASLLRRLKIIKNKTNRTLRRVGQGSLLATMLASPVKADSKNLHEDKDLNDINSSKITTIVDNNDTHKDDHIPFFERENLEIAQMMIENGELEIANFNLKNYSLSAEEMEMITPCERGKKLLRSVDGVVKFLSTQKEGKCLSGIQMLWSNIKTEVETDRHAYTAIDGMRKNSNFVEIKCDIKDFSKAPDGMFMVWEKGTSASGHIGVKKGLNEYSDRKRGLKKSNNRGSTGQVYGPHREFVLSSYTVTPELLVSFVSKGLLKPEVRQEKFAELRNQKQDVKMQYLANISPFGYFNKDGDFIAPKALNEKMLADNGNVSSDHATSKQIAKISTLRSKDRS